MSIIQDAYRNIQEKRIKKRNEKIILKEREKHHKDVVKKEKATRNDEKIAPEGAYISLRNINKIYPNHVQAVFDFNLDINKYEFIVFVGPSGCGKSTTLRMIAGLEKVTSGDLFIDGEYVNEEESKDRNISMVFQSYALYPHMSVYDNMAFGLRVNHVKRKEIDERVRKAAEILQISEYLDRKPNALSGGQCQRVALGRAICKDAKVFLMDEPLSNLDAKLRVQMRSEIVKLHNALKATTIYVTHDQTEAMTMASRIVVMNKGYVQQIGTPSEIYNSPSNIFVATFVGSPAMNMLNVNVKNDLIKFDEVNSIKMLDKDFNEKLNKFYNEQIELIKKEIEDWKNEFLSREQKTKRYNDLFNELTKEKLEIYINNLKINNSSELLESISSPEFKNKLDMYLKETLFNKNYEENIEIKELYNKYQNLIEESKKDNHNLIFGIRPEDIHRVNEKQDDNELFELRTTVAELLGAEYFVHLKFGNEEIVAKVDTNEVIDKNKIIPISFDKKKFHIFDPITTNRII